MIRTIITISILLLSFLSSYAQKTHTISVNFVGMKSNDGKLLVGLYNTEKTFLKKQYREMIAKIDQNKATVNFEVPTGIYAISAFHDKNDNKKMDTNFFGIPKEAIGTSNDAKGTFGPPKFKDAKFIVDKNISLTIKVAKLF